MTIDATVLSRLRQFQAEDLSFFMGVKKAGGWYEPRLGKTVIGVHVAMLDPEIKNIVIDCPKNAVIVWEEHIKEWAPKLCPELKVQSVRVTTKQTSQGERRLRWNWPRRGGKNFFIVVHGSLIADLDWLIESGYKMDMFIFDEYHKYMKRNTTKTYKGLSRLLRDVPRFLPLSGTPIDRGIQEFWPVLNICNPKLFPSYWRFVNTWCITNKGFFGTEIIGPKNLPNWFLQLKSYGRIRKRAECAPWMPEVQRVRILVDATEEQRRVYNEIMEDGFSWRQDGSLIVTATSIEKTIKFRQLLICPKLLDPALGWGASFEHLGDILEEAETDAERHIVVFTPFIAALDLLDTYLRTRGVEHITRLQGGIDPDELRSRIQSFKDRKGVMLCSTNYAQAFSLEPATACYHVGYEWSPNANKQAEDRLVPQVGINPIMSYYYTYRDSVDERISDCVVLKQENVDTVFQSTRIHTVD